MEIPIHLSGKGVTLSPEQEALIRVAVNRLERFFDRLVGCHVTVSVTNRFQGGAPVTWALRIALTVPGDELAITRQAKPSFREALDDAFDAARRQLQDYARELRGDVKAPADAPRGRVSRLFDYEGYGFLTADDGREIYFHRNSVLNDGFGRLTIGTTVRFVESEGEHGPQASTVLPLERATPATWVTEGGESWE
jgi:cold shock CspA family protein/ribosome-associated translation inhibitor RaiA